MKLRNLFILLWAINSGGLLRIFALTGIVVFLGLVVLIFFPSWVALAKLSGSCKSLNSMDTGLGHYILLAGAACPL